jgi:hypothetical protein
MLAAQLAGGIARTAVDPVPEVTDEASAVALLTTVQRAVIGIRHLADSAGRPQRGDRACAVVTVCSVDASFNREWHLPGNPQLGAGLDVPDRVRVPAVRGSRGNQMSESDTRPKGLQTVVDADYLS